MANVLIYTTPNCPHCLLLKDWLSRNAISFSVRDLAEDPAAREELSDIAGTFSVPVLVDGATVIIGFRPDLLEKHFFAH